MSRIAYCVTATFTDRRVAAEWLAWLQGGHVADVLAAGACDAEIVALDGPEPAIEVRYHFDSRQTFADYERLHAPRLRAAGRERFPPECGIRVRRAVGCVVHQVHHATAS